MIEHVKATARIPALQGQFGPRLLCYTTQLSPASLETIIGHDPRSKHWKQLPDDLLHIYKHLQRPTHPKRLESVIRYMRYRFIERPVIVGAFPAISIAVQNETPFEPIRSERGFSERGVGVLDFDLSRRNRRLVVDGLARASAALELVDLAESTDIADEAKTGLQKLLGEFTLPTVFYLPAPGTKPLEREEMEQLFHDFNFRVLHVKEKDAIALDHSDMYIALANRVGESELIRDFGGMERRAASLGSKSSAIVVQQFLLRFVRGATEGERFADSSNKVDLSNPNLTEDNIDDFEDRILAFLRAFSESMGADKFRDRERLHLSSPGWTALGTVFHDLFVRLRVPDLEAAARRLGEMDWRRSAPQWSEIVRPKVNKNGETVLGLLGGGGAQNRRIMADIVRKALGIHQLLRERGLLQEIPEEQAESGLAVPEQAIVEAAA